MHFWSQLQGPELSAALDLGTKCLFPGSGSIFKVCFSPWDGAWSLAVWGLCGATDQRFPGVWLSHLQADVWSLGHLSAPSPMILLEP